MEMHVRVTLKVARVARRGPDTVPLTQKPHAPLGAISLPRTIPQKTKRYDQWKVMKNTPTISQI
ncbi:hypothetical protein NQZ68_014463 [Dissostichus eleginoides]|nr:hypothetical protein NQZ68_014463 [Dissostichus eleginoides]